MMVSGIHGSNFLVDLHPPQYFIYQHPHAHVRVPKLQLLFLTVTI
jgi:hypothetical protein